MLVEEDCSPPPPPWRYRLHVTPVECGTQHGVSGVRNVQMRARGARRCVSGARSVQGKEQECWWRRIVLLILALGNGIFVALRDVFDPCFQNVVERDVVRIVCVAHARYLECLHTIRGIDDFNAEAVVIDEDFVLGLRRWIFSGDDVGAYLPFYQTLEKCVAVGVRATSGCRTGLRGASPLQSCARHEQWWGRCDKICCDSGSVV